MSDFKLNDHVYRLLEKEPFFAALSRRIEKRVGPVPTAGVCVNEAGHFEMVYNPAFFNKLSDAERTGVLVHEFYHLVFEHVTGRLPDELAGAMSNKAPDMKIQKLFKLWNIAADLAINYHIGRENLPDGCCFPGEGPFKELEGDQTAEFYYAWLREEVEKQSKNDSNKGEGGDSSEGEGSSFDPDNAGQFDSHDEWGGQASQEDKDALDIAKERLKDAMKGAAQEAATRGWGTISSSCRQDILDRLTSKVDWRKVLRYFVKTSQRANKRSTPKRLNRRYAYVHPGRKVERTANIAVSIDQSGSVSDSMLAAFYAELNGLSDIAAFTVVPFDTSVAEDAVFVWKKGKSHPQKRYLCGGTCFDAPTKYVNERKFDGHIVLTDMMAPKPKSSKCQRMWMTTPENAARPYFKTAERVVAIDERS